MATSAATIAENIIDMMRLQGMDHATVPWGKFYKLAERDRIKTVFMERLTKELRKKSFLLVEGSSVVIITKDFNSHPLKF